MRTRVTVLIPVYNAGHLALETIDSLKKQTALSQLQQILVIDDCSTDDSIKLFRENWTSQPIPLNVVRMPKNGGERRAVNHGMKLAAETSDWVFILHADDIARPHWAQSLLKLIEKTTDKVISIGSSWHSLFPDGTVVTSEEDADLNRDLARFSGRNSARDTLLMGGWWHISGCAIHLKKALDLGGFNPEMPQLGDVEFVIRAYKAGWELEYHPRALTLYRQHDGNVSSRSFRTCRDISETVQMMKLHADLLSEEEKRKLSFKLMKMSLRRFLGGFYRRDLTQLKYSLTSFKKLAFALDGK